MARRLLYSERKGGSGDADTYVYLESSSSFQKIRIDDGKAQVEGVYSRVVRWAREVFLPQGYPESVSSDYLHYQFWDCVQAYCSTIANALSMKATLAGLGVGKDKADALAATFTWLLKDGTGMVTSIAFAYWKGTQLDCNSKQWRLFADFINNLNFMVRLLGPALPVPYIGVLCVSGVLGSLVGAAGQSTRAALTVHQARSDNMADVSAKDGSQETLVNLVGLITNLTLLPYFTSTLGITWVTFLTCMFFHLYANHKAMRALVLHSLNRPRLLHVFNSFLAHDSRSLSTVVSPTEANLAEPLLFGPAFISDYFPCGFRVSMGCSLHWALSRCWGSAAGTLYEAAKETFKEEKYMLCANLPRRQLHIVYRSGLTSEDELKAAFTAFLLVHNYCHQVKGTPLSERFMVPPFTSTTTTTTTTIKRDYELISEVNKIVMREFPILLKSLEEQEWSVDKLHFGAEMWELLEE